VQVGQRDAMRSRIWERRVGGAAAAEFGIDLDHVTDIDHQQERRASFGGGQRAGVAFGLGAGAQQRVVEAPGVAEGLHLLRFEHEAAATVAVDEAVAAAAVAVCELNAALEHVSVVARVVARRVWRGAIEQRAQLTDEELVVRALGAAGGAPAADEGAGLRG